MRISTGGRIDRGAPIFFRFDGREYSGFGGDTLASALLANGVHRVATSVTLRRPRGVVTAGSGEPSAIVHVEAPFPETMVPATMLELQDGLVAHGLAGRGVLPDPPPEARYDGVYHHCDVLVVGAGPAGLSAALAAARTGARVVLADENPEPGGHLLGTADEVDGRPGADWAAGVTAEFDAAEDVRVLARTTVIGLYDHGWCVARERRPAGLARERLWRIRARRVVLATGAQERLLAFTDNDRPGVMLAGAARTYLHRFGVLPGRRAVVLTCDDSAHTAAAELACAGVELAEVVDLRTAQPAVAALGEDRVTGVRLGERVVDADLLLVSGGLAPALQLYAQAGGVLRYDPAAAAALPGGCRQPVVPVGGANGTRTLAAALAEGAQAGAAAAAACGFRATAPPLPAVGVEPEPTPPGDAWLLPGPGPRFVDLHRDVTAEDVVAATGLGLRSVEHVKRYTTAGTGLDQARTAPSLVARVVADALGMDVADLATTSYRPPASPVGFAALAGRNRGALHDAVRITVLHDLHVAAGAEFENVGQWKRPWFYPRPGEEMAAAVLRECRAARTDVARMDASTLGKIEVTGPDAAEFLDRIYPNMMSTLAVGAIRYGVMCRPDGMIFDDGTVIRLGSQRFLVTTTTGNAAVVLDWLEEWLQTEWPGLRVHCTSVTEQWATVALVGPRSREVLAGLAPDLDVSAPAFPFMTWREATVAGLAALVCRISFSGELAYEINVIGWDGPALWAALDGVTPYGTETMHVLRAEKGYPIVGQDTDGTVTPYDLGMSWIVSKKKRDFLGKRSFRRADTARPDRKHLVALLPEDPEVLLPEGGQVVGETAAPPALGHVTSSYRSAVLGRTFALALVASGRDRIGERLHVPVDGTAVPVTVAAPVLYDPEGARRDG